MEDKEKELREEGMEAGGKEKKERSFYVCRRLKRSSDKLLVRMESRGRSREQNRPRESYQDRKEHNKAVEVSEE
jgi:hypothetical protein